MGNDKKNWIGIDETRLGKGQKDEKGEKDGKDENDEKVKKGLDRSEE